MLGLILPTIISVLPFFLTCLTFLIHPFLISSSVFHQWEKCRPNIVKLPSWDFVLWVSARFSFLSLLSLSSLTTLALFVTCFLQHTRDLVYLFILFVSIRFFFISTVRCFFFFIDFSARVRRQANLRLPFNMWKDNLSIHMIQQSKIVSTLNLMMIDITHAFSIVYRCVTCFTMATTPHSIQQTGQNQESRISTQVGRHGWSR